MYCGFELLALIIYSPALQETTEKKKIAPFLLGQKHGKKSKPNSKSKPNTKSLQFRDKSQAPYT